jgi:hypothetical protein
MTLPTPGPASPQEPVTPAQADEEAILREVTRVSRNVLGLTLGMLFGFGLFLATNILVLKGGPHVGANLQHLNQFFPGYGVTFAGSFLGLIYGFLTGYISGFFIAAVYNGVASFRLR